MEKNLFGCLNLLKNVKTMLIVVQNYTQNLFIAFKWPILVVSA